ncbi:MAG: hypothetical protein OEM77_05540 [Nitrosopumilus sp.]|nr:hypothetical protein [Nitrosopumilus sp.]MDH3735398.1 hypothetical protein [Nitrosopumilus sp.]MDH3822240.1 hypothetical protein [Nitrosopumilus sp.]MDH3832568.1 hypothetical protein [Nitrosopumilus sp.]
MDEIKINIGTLVLDGFDFHDHVRITSEFNQELHRLLVKNGLKTDNSESNTVQNINVRNLRIDKNINSQSIGNQLANSVYQNLNAQKKSITQKSN